MKHAVQLSSILLFASLSSLCAAAQDEGVLRLFTGARIIDGRGGEPLENGAMLVRDGRVEALGSIIDLDIPVGVERIDLSGKTVIPGLVNAHGHVASDARNLLGVYARYGVTTVVSLGGEDAGHVAFREAQDPAHPTEARLLLAGPVQEDYTTAEAARAGVMAVKALGADWVKARVQSGSMPETVYGPLIETAHAQGLKVAAHLYDLADAKGLLRQGLDVIAHSIRDQEVDQELLDLMRANGACLIPTVARDVSTYVYETRPEFFDDPFFLREADPALMMQLQEPQRQARDAANAARGKADVAMGQHNLKAVHDAGLRVAMGTDSGASRERFPGYMEHLELELMVQAGLTPLEAIKAATSVATDCMDIDDAGTLEAGKWADFIVLAVNPLSDITNTRTLESVWMAGEQVPGAGTE